MSCVRCQIVRAKAIAYTMKMAGSSAASIVDALQRRYGPDYYLGGSSIYRRTTTGPERIL